MAAKRLYLKGILKEMTHRYIITENKVRSLCVISQQRCFRLLVREGYWNGISLIGFMS